MKKSVFMVCCGLSAALLSVSAVAADGQKHRGQGVLPENPAYEAACGTCHMPYPPMLLPQDSWRLIIPDSGEHFGESLPLSPEEIRQMRAYTTENAADKSSAKRAQKITRSLAGKSPLRVTEVPYLIEKHHEVTADVFKRPAVGGFANCAACHPNAKIGDFKDDDVRIPN